MSALWSYIVDGLAGRGRGPPRDNDIAHAHSTAHAYAQPLQWDARHEGRGADVIPVGGDHRENGRTMEPPRIHVRFDPNRADAHANATWEHSDDAQRRDYERRKLDSKRREDARRRHALHHSRDGATHVHVHARSLAHVHARSLADGSDAREVERRAIAVTARRKHDVDEVEVPQEHAVVRDSERRAVEDGGRRKRRAEDGDGQEPPRKSRRVAAAKEQAASHVVAQGPHEAHGGGVARPPSGVARVTLRVPVPATAAHAPATTAPGRSSVEVARALLSVAERASRVAVQPPPRQDCDDENGHYIYREGELLNDRYVVVRQLGEGTFGKVLECVDCDSDARVAIKVIKNIPKYRQAAKMEMGVLSALRKHDPHCDNRCIQMLSWFDHRNHICMVFGLLAMSLFDFLKANEFTPFPLDHIRHFAYQLVKAVEYMHRLQLVHTDLKPENILLTDETFKTQYSNRRRKLARVLNRTDIMVIDFGSATFNDQHHTTIVSTRHYRAPEIVLENGWSYPCDMWSLGCILVELYTGEAVFQTHYDVEHLAIMERLIGPIPRSLVERSRFRSEYFNQGRLRWPQMATDSKSIDFVQQHCKPLERLLLSGRHTSDLVLFHDFVSRMLVYDPASRMTASEAIRHPFLAQYSYFNGDPHRRN